MDKVYIICYKLANELSDIKLYTSYEKALEVLSYYADTHQILEYLVVDEIAERPLFAYSYRNGIIHKVKV